MTLLPILIEPGVYDEASDYAAQGRWIEADKVRFWKGLPERIGGWVKLTTSVLDTPCRGIHAWQALDGSRWIAFGTQNKLWVFDVSNETLHDITPVGLPPGDGSGDANIGPWGDQEWGTPLAWGGQGAPLITGANARTWSLDNYGEDLIANYFGGPIYRWDRSVGTGQVAEVLPNSPQIARGIFVNDENQQLVAIGAHDGTNDDGMNIRWSDDGNPEEWTPSATNTAGSRRIQEGGQIIGSIKTRATTLVLTDIAAYAMTFRGQPFIYGINLVGKNCGLIGPNAGVDNNGVVMWMSQEQFFQYDGAVRPLPCDLHARIFDNINKAEGFKVFVGQTHAFRENWIHYPITQGGLENSRYAIYNFAEMVWSPGTIERTSWLDNNVAANFPIATDGAGNIYLQENGILGDGSRIDYTLESAEIEQVSGQQFTHIKKVVPDYERLTGDHTLELVMRQYPQASPKPKGPYMFNSATKRMSVRARGRSFRLRFSNSETGSDFRMGRYRADVRLHGGR